MLILPLRNQHSDYLVKSYQQDATPKELLRHRSDATSIWQLSEWKMRMIQAKFPRLQDKMNYEKVGERRVILNKMVLLYDFSCSKIGHNEILSTFMLDRNNYLDTKHWRGGRLRYILNRLSAFEVVYNSKFRCYF